MTRLTLLLATLFTVAVACTQVKLNNSVGTVDTGTGGDGTADVSEVDGTPTDSASDAQADLSGDVDPTEGVPETTPGDTAEVDACEPQCEGLQCGDDGCGGDCGACGDGEVCNAGACCAPDCEDVACGDDGCGGVCGVCAEGDVCQEGVCVSGQTCEPDCVEKYCGDDGCGGACGECIYLDDLTDEELEKDGSLRALYEAGVAHGESAFVDELSSKLAAAGLSGAVSLALPVTTGTSVDLDSGKLKCPFLAHLGEEEPEAIGCDQWVNESSGAVYADVVAALANPANMPEEVTSSPYGKDAEDAFRTGVITGNERGRARARWDLASTEAPVCDATAGPISASKAKGVILGAQHFAAVLKTIMDSASFPFAGSYPEIPINIELCSFAASLLDVAHDVAKATPVEELPLSQPCEGYNPPPDQAASYELATTEFLDGVSKGIDAEYYIAVVAFFGEAECGLGP